MGKPLAAAALAGGAIVAAVLVSAACDDDTVRLGDYRTDCTADCDCTLVFIGDLSSCGCTNAAINVADLPKYIADAKDRQDMPFPDCGGAPCGSVAPAWCNQGRCDTCAPPLGECGADAGPACKLARSSGACLLCQPGTDCPLDPPDPCRVLHCQNGVVTEKLLCTDAGD